jgi:hypothetical protein
MDTTDTHSAGLVGFGNDAGPVLPVVDGELVAPGGQGSGEEHIHFDHSADKKKVYQEGISGENFSVREAEESEEDSGSSQLF